MVDGRYFFRPEHANALQWLQASRYVKGYLTIDRTLYRVTARGERYLATKEASR